jgi:acetylornithine deacetylase
MARPLWFEIEIQGKPVGIQRRCQGVSGIELGDKITKAVEALEAKRVATAKHPLYPKPIDALPCMIGAFPLRQFSEPVPSDVPAEGQHADRPRRRSSPSTEYLGQEH